MSLLEEMNQKATAQGIPLSAHLDITWQLQRTVRTLLPRPRRRGRDDIRRD